jgi:hypothetical protein
MLGDGHVFPGNEAMAIELESRLIVIRALGVAIKRSAATPAMHQVPELVLLSVPEAFDVA